MMGRMVQAAVVGVHEVDADEPCHLVEVLIDGAEGPLEIAAFTQPVQGMDRSNWQVPWQEVLLDVAGVNVLAGPHLSDQDHEHWRGSVRLAFFFHYLDLKHDLQSPVGPLVLPALSARPERLAQLRYEAP